MARQDRVQSDVHYGVTSILKKSLWPTRQSEIAWCKITMQEQIWEAVGGCRSVYL